MHTQPTANIRGGLRTLSGPDMGWIARWLGDSRALRTHAVRCCFPSIQPVSAACQVSLTGLSALLPTSDTRGSPSFDRKLDRNGTTTDEPLRTDTRDPRPECRCHLLLVCQRGGQMVDVSSAVTIANAQWPQVIRIAFLSSLLLRPSTRCASSKPFRCRAS